MSGGGLLRFGFVLADKSSSQEEIAALKTARAVQEAIDLERMKVTIAKGLVRRSAGLE